MYGDWDRLEDEEFWKIRGAWRCYLDCKTDEERLEKEASLEASLRRYDHLAELMEKQLYFSWIKQMRFRLSIDHVWDVVDGFFLHPIILRRRIDTSLETPSQPSDKYLGIQDGQSES